MFAKDFMRGICASGVEPQRLHDCGFNWIRLGSGFPYHNDGSICDIYLENKEKIKKYKDAGFQVMAITPYPKRFEEYGINTATEEGLLQVEDILAFLAEDLKGLVDGWQITNEMNVYFFRAPLSLDQSIDFVIAGLKGVKRVDQEVLLGFNTSEFIESAQYMVNKLMAHEHLFNYMGYDGYYGTWIEGTPKDYVETIEHIHALTKKPVIMQEFGFSSTGEVIKPGEFDELMKTFGYRDFEDAKAHCEEFLDKVPKRMAEMIKSAPREEWEDSLRGMESHLLKKWVGGSDELPHNEQGQAKFYETLLPMLANCKGLIGAFVFSWQDRGRCFYCLEEDCPCETAWGINDKNGDPKPAYHIIKKHFTNAI